MANSPKTFDSLVNLLDKFDKRRKNQDISPSTLTSSLSNPDSPSNSKRGSSASNSFSSSNIFNNLNFSFNNKSTKVDHSNGKQLKESETISNSNLLVIDDDEYDDPTETFDPVKIAKSDDSCEPTETVRKLSTSSSLYKLGSQVFDDMAWNNATFSNVVDEAESIRQRFVSKKKNLDLSIKDKLKQSPSSLENSLKVPNSGLKTTQSDIDIQKTYLEEDCTMKTSEENISNTENKNQSPIPELCIPEEEQLVDSSSGLKSLVDHENEHKIKSELKNDLKEMARGEEASKSGSNMKINHTITNIQANSKTNKERDTSFNIRQNTNIKIQVSKEKLTVQHLFYRTVFTYKHLLLPIMVLLFAFFVIMPRKWHYFTMTYSFGILSGLSIAGFILYALVKFELIDYVTTFLKNKAVTEKVLDTDDENKTDNQNIEIDEKSRLNMNQQIHSLLIQSAILKENKSFDGIYRGWMNELREVYTPDNYFLNKTRSVYINLDGTMLRLQTTNRQVPKRAVCNEKIVCTFNKFRIYDLTGCKVQILPSELCRKRYWAKKYPLCLSGVKLVSSSTTQYKPIQTPASHNKHTKVAASVSANSINSIANSIVSGDSSFPTSPTTQIIGKDGSKLEPDTLILFARTDREKEEWFKLFNKSCAKKLQDSNHFSKLNEKRMQLLTAEKRPASTSIVSNNIDLAALKKASENNNSGYNFSYSASNDKIIYRLGEPNSVLVPSTNSHSNINTSETITKNTDNQMQHDLPGTKPVEQVEMNTQTENGLIYDSSLAFMNTFLIRLFADFFEHKYWISKIQTKIQNKLNTIKLPYFMEGLNIINLDLGSVVPLIKQASEPWYDEKGLWVHLDLDYSGGVQILISTKLNLMKLKANSGCDSKSQSTNQNSANAMFSFKNDNEQSISSSLNSPIKSQDELLENSFSDQSSFNQSFEKPKRDRPAIIDSEAEDSPESSGDEYTHSDFSLNENSQTSTNSDDKLVETANTSKKLLNFVSKIAASNYFQKATENKYIKMAMENVSNCQLNLNVEVNRINGKLALNIPPHPSDRIWYGFVEKPQMTLVATPQVGDKEVSYAAISDWIAEKLKQEFQKVLVFPNMDDFYIPILNSEVNYQNW